MTFRHIEMKDPNRVRTSQEACDLARIFSKLGNKRDEEKAIKRALSGEISELRYLITKPTLFLLDPIGFKGMSLDVVKKMMSKRSYEVLITLMVENIKRHRKNPAMMTHFKKMFGVDDLSKLDQICKKTRPEAEIKDYYIDRLTYKNGAGI